MARALKVGRTVCRWHTEVLRSPFSPGVWAEDPEWQSCQLQLWAKSRMDTPARSESSLLSPRPTSCRGWANVRQGKHSQEEVCDRASK